jgi:hypothetical protein
MIGTVTRHNDIGTIYNKAPQDQDYWVLIYTDEGEAIALTYGNSFVASVQQLFACTEDEELQNFIDENNIYLDQSRKMGDVNLDRFFSDTE